MRNQLTSHWSAWSQAPCRAHDLQQKIKRFTLRIYQEKQYSHEELSFLQGKNGNKTLREVIEDNKWVFQRCLGGSVS